MTQVTISFSRKYAPIWLVFPLLLGACDPAATAQGDAPPEAGVLGPTRDGPPGAAEGSCWGKTVSPAVVQTVVSQVQIRPAKVNPDGTVSAPPKYRTKESQEIVTPRKDNWFETPCAEALTPEIISTLQRALAARNFYKGAINGTLDARTRAAVQNFQRVEGRDSPVLTLTTARQLGVIAVERQPSE